MSAPARGRVDWRQVRALVRVYLVMSVRKMPLRTMRGEKKSGGIAPILFLTAIYALLGLALAVMLAVAKDLFLGSFIAHTMTLLVVGTAAMGEASEVLFSTSENEVLGHKPVLPATLVTAKAISISAFTLLLAAALNAGSTVALFFVEGARPIAPLAHVVSVVIATTFVGAAVVCVYGLIARLLGRERLQRVVTWAQVASTVFLAVGFQLVPRLLDARTGFDVAGLLRGHVLVWLWPPCWFAAFDAWLGSTAVDPRYAQLALLGLGVTLGCVWLGLLRLPSTGGDASRLQEEQRPVLVPAPAAVAGGGTWIERLLAPWLRDPIERAAFRLAQAYLLRERSVKVRLAAAFSYYLVFPMLALVDPRRSYFLPLMMLWMCALVPVTVMDLLRLSANPAAADLFLYAPIDGGARLFHGVRKAAIALVQVPLLVYLTLVTVWAMRATPESLWLMLPALIAMPTLSLLPGLTGEYLPLSSSTRTGQRTLQIVITFAVMIPAGVVGFLSMWAQKNGLLWIMLGIELALMIALHALLRRIVARRSARSGRTSRAQVAAS